MDIALLHPIHEIDLPGVDAHVSNSVALEKFQQRNSERASEIAVAYSSIQDCINHQQMSVIPDSPDTPKGAHEEP